MITRRQFLGGGVILAVAPAIVKAENIMRVVAPKGYEFNGEPGGVYIIRNSSTGAIDAFFGTDENQYLPSGYDMYRYIGRCDTFNEGERVKVINHYNRVCLRQY